MDISVNTAEKLDTARILVVENELDILDVTTRLLEHFGYLVTSATGSNEAINKIKDNPNAFDAVITDYSLPIINGIELAALIKEISADVPIVLYSGKIDIIEERQITEACIAGVIRKPCEVKKLDSIIKKVIEEKGRQ